MKCSRYLGSPLRANSQNATVRCPGDLTEILYHASLATRNTPVKEAAAQTMMASMRFSIFFIVFLLWLRVGIVQRIRFRFCVYLAVLIDILLSLHLFEVPHAPTLVEVGFCRGVEAQIDPPALARDGLHPVLLLAFRCGLAEIEVEIFPHSTRKLARTSRRNNWQKLQSPSWGEGP